MKAPALVACNQIVPAAIVARDDFQQIVAIMWFAALTAQIAAK
jgi:hypothetical protein